KTQWQMRLPVEQEIGGPVRLEPDGDDVGALTRTGLFASGVTDLDSGIFHRGAQQAVDVEIQSFQMLLDLFIGLIFQRFGVAVVNPSGLADVDLNAAVLLLAFAEVGPLLVGIDYPVNELSGVLRQAFGVRREYAGCHDTREAREAIAAARLN